MDRFNNLIKNLKGQHKMGKFLLFLFMFFFIFKIINYILTFFDISKELGYSYFIWFSILFFLFVLLPLKNTYLNFKPNDNVSPNPVGGGASGGGGAAASGGGPAASGGGPAASGAAAASGGGGGGATVTTGNNLRLPN
jgi:hypothetical protein